MSCSFSTDEMLGVCVCEREKDWILPSVVQVFTLPTTMHDVWYHAGADVVVRQDRAVSLCSLGVGSPASAQDAAVQSSGAFQLLQHAAAQGLPQLAGGDCLQACTPRTDGHGV